MGGRERETGGKAVEEAVREAEGEAVREAEADPGRDVEGASQAFPDV